MRAILVAVALAAVACSTSGVIAPTTGGSSSGPPTAGSGSASTTGAGRTATASSASGGAASSSGGSAHGSSGGLSDSGTSGGGSTAGAASSSAGVAAGGSSSHSSATSGGGTSGSGTSGNGTSGGSSAGSSTAGGSTGAPSPTCANVAIGGGGYVLSIYPHPLQQGLAYLRTDVGGAYRFDATSQSWLPLLDGFSAGADYSVEGLAIDPEDATRLYAVTGSSGTNAFLSSSTQGSSWTTNSIQGLTYVYGNGPNRWGGERLVVDPTSSSVLLFGSRSNGLFLSQNRGAAWSQVASVPVGGTDPNSASDPTGAVGVSAVAFDASSAGAAFASSYGQGIYGSTDHGQSWGQIPSAPTDAIRLAAGGGHLYVAAESGVFRYDEASKSWATLAQPAAAGFSGLAIDPQNSLHVLVGENSATAAPTFETTNGGQSWTPLTFQQIAAVPWWPTSFFRNNMGCLAFDPFNSSHVWETDWFGVWQTTGLGTSPGVWTSDVAGVEEVVVHTLLSPPTGTELFSGVADVDGFEHVDDAGQPSLTSYPAHGIDYQTSGRHQDTYSFALDPETPQHLARMEGVRGVASWGYVSANAGQSWTAIANAPAGVVGRRVAIASSGQAGVASDHMVVLDDSGLLWFSSDASNASATWTEVLDGGLALTDWDHSRPLTADAVQPDVFYAYAGGKLYGSTPSGGSVAFTAVNSSLTGGGVNSVDLRAGTAAQELWASVNGALYHSVNGGKALTRLGAGALANVVDFGIGVAAPGAASPTIFVLGSLTGSTDVLFRSIDLGATWQDVGVAGEALGDGLGVVEASAQTFGRVFVGSGGRGVFVCDSP